MSRLILALFAITASSLAAQPVSIFDGKTLDGWDYDPKVWRVEDGMITGGSTTEKIKENHFICTKKNYQNFELKLKIKVGGDPKTGMLNSGIQIRSMRVPGGAHMSGYQVDCGAGWFGKIYDEARRNKVIWAPTPEQQAALDKVVDVPGWNEYRIRAEGTRIQTWINGVLCIDFTETDKNIALDGFIGPQVHSGGACLVQVKDVTIEELPPTPGAPTWESLGGVEAARKLVAPAPKGKAAPNPQSKIRNPKSKDTSYNNVQGTALTAQEQLKKFHVADGYEIELVVQEDVDAGIGKFVSVYFDQRGRLWTQTALEYPVDANENPAAAEAVYARKGKDKILVYPREALNDLAPGGLKNPTVYADGLAIPLGILPWGPGDQCYALHGHDLLLLKDTDGDGQSDQREVILTGFGVQDSHLFPHQFTRAPGGWIWMAQGLFNNSAVKRPGSDEVIAWPKCSMARMRPDGSEFEVTSTGPNNIWGLVMTGEGETFIQEANDYGYPVMPLHEYAYYPGGMAGLRKSYQPEFPPAAEFRMGGTGLSGLALLENGPAKDPKADLTMLVANPIISKIQTLAMLRDGPYWNLEQLPDILTCDDPFFRPVGMTQGPDGAIYIVDWYNKIISHNEVPRAHPDRDKTRGRIWRVKPKAAKGEVPDFTQLSSEELIALLGTEPVGRSHLAWQTLADRDLDALNRLDHWSTQEYRNGGAKDEILALGRALADSASVAKLLAFAKPSLPGPLAQSSRGPQQIPVRQAYDREFERFLVRMFLERHPDLVAKFLDSEAAANLPVESRVLASLALEPRSSASRVAKLLPQLDRAPNDEELLRLAQFPNEPGVATALKTLLSNEKSRTSVAEKLLAQRTALDAKKIAPLLTEAAKAMLGTSPQLALQLIGGFQLAALEPDLIALARRDAVPGVPILHTLRDLHSGESELFATLAQSDPDPLTRTAALEALAASSAPDATARLLTLYPELTPGQRKAALNTVSSTKAGAKTLVTALLDKTLPQSDLDGPTVERLATVLGDDPAIAQLQDQLGGIFRKVLLLDGQETAWTDSKITLDGPFTVETWVRLAPDISNRDEILGTPGGLEMNFAGSTFRVYAGPQLRDVVTATKPMTPDLWTHIAVTRDAKGILRIYQNGELDATASKPAPLKWENCRIGWSGPKGGTEGALTEFRVWDHPRTPQEIRANFDRILDTAEGMVRHDSNWGTPGKGARVAKTLDTPPLLTEEQAVALDAKFKKLTALAPTGNPEKGQLLSGLCMACHQIGAAGGQIGPNLSGAGAMGLEGVLRNILTPNAAMEAGYRIFRVELKNGDLIDAFYVSEDKTAIVVRQPGAADRRLNKSDIATTQYIRRSLMPEGLLDALSDEQAADLLAYLMTLKG